ncbi:MAG: RluA family pseudouridine synthase [Spirochaetaceae bacterium]|jgi:23S rRNA pseudouridine955/2504/2580 synthase|nr:RluA family pseudouridine synthase [Spirochaetaceae bacterium]
MKGVEILYEDDDCLVINKAAGLPVQGGCGAEVNLDAILTALYKPRPLLVHRLDKDTSGVILTAKSSAAAAYFSRAIAGGQARKRYLAICNAPRMRRDAASTQSVGVGEGTIDSDLTQKGAKKAAVTHYRRLARNGEYALFQLELGTGRMHQIRRHMAQSGQPVLGDGKYGDFSLNKRFRKESGVKQQLLHAVNLVLPRQNGGILEISAPLPAHFRKALEILGFSGVFAAGGE